MARLTIPDEQTFAEFTVVTSTAAFPITFSLFAKADLTVYVDDVALEQSDFSFTGTLLDGGGYDGGTVTLNTAVDDVTVRIERNVSPERTSNFAPASTTPVGSVDQALNRLTAVQQDIRRSKVTLPIGERANLFHSYDADGNSQAVPGAVPSLPVTSFAATLLAAASNSAFLTALGQIAGTFVNFLQAGTGAVTRTMQAKGRDIISVKDFGAVGDGSTDDTAAIAAALAYAATLVRTSANVDAPESGGVTVYVPAGVYIVSDTLVVETGTYFIGAGKTSTVLQNTTTNKTLVRNGLGAVYNAYGCKIADMALYGARTSTDQWGVDLLRPIKGVVENVFIQNMGAGGLRIRQGISFEVVRVHSILSAGPGFLTGEGVISWADQSTDANHYPTNAVRFHECQGIRNDGPGFRFGPYTNGCTISGGSYEYNYNSSPSNTGHSIEVLSTGGYLPNLIEDVWCEGPCQSHILVNAVSTYTRIKNFKHVGDGDGVEPGTGETDRAIIVTNGAVEIDNPAGHGGSYKSIGGNITPFRVNKANGAVIYLTDPIGSTLTRNSLWVEDETGATGAMPNNLFQTVHGTVRGAPQRTYSDQTDVGPGFYREDEAYPYVRYEPFFRGLGFGGGGASPDVAIGRVATRTIGIINNSFGSDPRFLQLSTAWNENRCLVGTQQLYPGTDGTIRTKGSDPSSGTDGNPLAQKVGVPGSATAAGKPGDWAADASYSYFYTGDGSTHTWVRSTAATW